jgi:hypothetical protein
MISALDGGGWSTSHPGRLYPGKDLVAIVQEAGGAPGWVWIGAEFDPWTFQPVASRYTD